MSLSREQAQALTRSTRDELAAHFRRDMNGIYYTEIEEQHRRKGLDPMTCNDSICRSAVAHADALLASDALTRMLADAWDAGYDVALGKPQPTPNPYRTTHQLDATEQRENR